MRFSTFSIRAKVLVVATLLVILLATILVGVARHGIISLNERNYQRVRAGSVELRKEELRSEVSIALGVIQSIYDETKATGGDMEMAKKHALQQLRHIRFFENKSGYIFAHALEGDRAKAVLIPVKPELEGSDITDLKDKNNTYFIRESMKAARSGGGYVEYLFPKKKGSTPSLKLTYVGHFAPWDWEVGTGVYLDDLEAQAAKIKAAGAEEAAREFYGTCAVAAVALVLIIAFISFGIGRLLKPLQSMVALVRDLAQGEGDLTRRLPVTSKDEVGTLSEEFNRFMSKIREILLEAAMESQEVAMCSQTLSKTSEGLAEDFVSLAEKSSSVATASEEMAATTNEIASNCICAAEGASLASEKATTGAAILEKTLESMRRLAEKVTASAHTVEGLGARSDQIGAIINTIEDIADQTNLLALNAAIEAARAGEQGRGFAVVADEVRALAERTAKATREIAGMIKSIQAETKSAVAVMEDGVREVEIGREEATRSGAALQEILDQVERVTSQVNQIAVAAEEQSAATLEITSNVHELNDVLQQGVHSLRESSKTAHGMQELSDDLNTVIGRFRLS